MFITLIRNFRLRLQLRRSIGRLLSRADDHLLDDIGLTRSDVEQLIRSPRPDSSQTRMILALHAGVMRRV